MISNNKKQSRKAGMPPGTLIHVGRQKSDTVKISVIDYNEAEHVETYCKNAKDCFRFKDNDAISWINIDGLHDTEAIAAIGDYYGLHPLLLEDVLNTRHRPKTEEYDDYVFLTLKMLGISKDGHSVSTEQVSFVLGKNWLISFQEEEGDIFDAIRQRLRESKGNLRKMGADYLLYRLIDTVVDNYFFVTEHIGDATEALEEKVLQSPDKYTLHNIQRLKKQLINLRKAVNPLREAVSLLEKDANQLIEESTNRYLRDVYEHIIQVSDTIETHRDMLASIMDLYLSSLSNRMNEVMKVLTIIATIFIPLTFVAGIYGMNFNPEVSRYNMPELNWKYGYFGAWLIMIIIFVGMVVYFKRKKWL